MTTATYAHPEEDQALLLIQAVRLYEEVLSEVDENLTNGKPRLSHCDGGPIERWCAFDDLHPDIADEVVIEINAEKAVKTLHKALKAVVSGETTASSSAIRRWNRLIEQQPRVAQRAVLRARPLLLADAVSGRKMDADRIFQAFESRYGVLKVQKATTADKDFEKVLEKEMTR